MSEETKRKISESMKGYHPKTEFEKGCISWNKGQKGLQVAWNKGKLGLQGGYHLSDITKEKMSEWNKTHLPKYAFKKGQHPSTKTEFKIGNHLGFKKGNQFGIKFTKEQRANQIFPLRDTKIEIKIQDFLKQLNIEFFTHQYMSEIEHRYQCDILIPSMKMVIECDGDYWHKYPIGIEIDHIRTKELLEKGFKVLRLWENEINKMSIERFQECIRSC